MRPRARKCLEVRYRSRGGSNRTTALFDNLSERLGGILDRLTGRGSLSEADVDAAMREVRRALLEADVALEVVRSFTDRVREQAIGATVVKSVTPGQMVVKIVHDELVATLGSDGQTIDLNAVPPVADHDGRPAGLRQNHHHRKARPPHDPARQAQGADGLARHLPPGGDGAVGRARARPRHSDAADRGGPEAGADRKARAGSRQARRLRRGAARHRRPHHARRRDDERGGRDQSHGQSA